MGNFDDMDNKYRANDQYVSPNSLVLLGIDMSYIMKLQNSPVYVKSGLFPS